MKTFGELLTDYMKRTGTSDSELARTLGVQRQTIFRWKEGLVERPRHRDDVLLCAKKLRLTPAERDELLLAAGFPPENPETVLPIQPPQEIAPPIVAPPIVPPAPMVEPTPLALSTQPIQSKRKLALVLALVAFALIAVVAFFALQPQVAYPVAAPGEQLIVLARFDSTAVKLPTDLPSRQLPTDVAPSQVGGFTARLQAALEREVRAARLDNVRIIVWHEAIHDANTATWLRQRTQATIVVWGKPQDDKLAIALAGAPTPSRIDDMPLDALIAAPSDALTIANASPEELQALALLALSQLHLNQGDFGLARASLTQAQSRPLDDAALATVSLNLGYVLQIAEPPELGDAIRFYSQTLTLAPDTATAYLNRGIAYLRLNNALWQTDFERVLSIDSNHGGARVALCWAFALDQKPDLALPHCDAAVSNGVTARSREARAIVYAQQGKFSDAANDLQKFIDWLERQPASLRARYGTSPAEWLSAFKANTNPFDIAALDKLRRE